MPAHWRPRRSLRAEPWDRRPVQRPGAGPSGNFKPGQVRLAIFCGILLGLGMALPQNLAGTEPPPQRALAAPAPIRVIDGDTFDHGGERIRIADIDTPELRGRCDAEEALARRARQRLETLLREGPFELRRLGRDEDRYDRKLRVVIRDGRSLGDRLVAEGLARTWTGRREPWC
jgi:endonuclease YncB( thermonuclease family)